MHTPLRRLAPDMDPDVIATIDARLADVSAQYGVRIPWAIESGSRAWGFPSPDSDYDCRFFYVRAPGAYAGPWRPRDVIETPLDAVLDVNGWDLLKAVKLAGTGNATVGEWLHSPLQYFGEPDFRDDLLALVEQVTDPGSVVRHYMHVGRHQWTRTGCDGGQVPLKRAFYALRPAAVLHWMRAHGYGTPPMNLLQLFAEAPPPAEVADATRELIARKAVTREIGVGTIPAPIVRFVEQQLAEAEHLAVPARRATAARRAEATERFLALVQRWGPADRSG